MLQLSITEEARDGLLAYAARVGATLTALAEALGLAAAQGECDLPHAIVEEARRITAERRSRRPPTIET